MNTKTTFTILATIAVMAALASVFAATPAQAKITEEIIEQSCTNKGGNQAGGQQPECNNPDAQEQTTVTEKQNPAGSPPPGQNK